MDLPAPVETLERSRPPYRDGTSDELISADKGGITGGPGISCGVASNGDIGSHPNKYSSMITPRDHQSHEKV